MKPIPDWFAWLDAAIKCEPEYKERRKAIAAASGWPTCACGQLCADLPRNEWNDAPLDEELYGLGMQFSASIKERKWEDAKETMLKIEARTTELLTQPK